MMNNEIFVKKKGKLSMVVKKKILVLIGILAIFLMINSIKSEATLQANGNPGKTDLMNSWVINIRNMEATGGMTTYFVWIPRYEYKILGDRGGLSTANRRIDVNFITKETINATAGYKIPEAFWWDNNSNGVQDAGEQLTGY